MTIRDPRPGAAPGAGSRAIVRAQGSILLPLLAVLAAAPTVPSPAPDAPARPATVHFADGSQLTLVHWTFSYEFLTAKPGEMPSGPVRRDAHELHTGSRATPLEGAQLLIEYKPTEVTRTGESGDTAKEKVLRPVGLVVVRAGKKSGLKVQPPEREFLVGEGAKSVNVLPRTLDLLGETLAGTRRELCLVSLSDLAECNLADDARVVAVDFP